MDVVVWLLLPLLVWFAVGLVVALRLGPTLRGIRRRTTMPTR